jgi:hypothetical protein
MPRIPNEETRAELRSRAYQMRLKRISYRDIALELGVSHTTVKTLCDEYIANLNTPEAEELRKAELDKLDDLEALARRLLDDQHVAFQHGKVVTLDGKPISDTEPVFKAIDRILKTSERRSKYLGLDMPTKSEHTVKTNSVVDDSILSLVEEMERKNQEDRERFA